MDIQHRLLIVFRVHRFLGESKCVKSIRANHGEIHFYENEMTLTLTRTHFGLLPADVLQPLIEGQDPLKVSAF